MTKKIDGVMAVVDGTKGVIYIDPDCETLELMKKRKAEEDEKRVLLQTLKGKDNITVDGQKIMLYANIGNIKDLAKVFRMMLAESGFSEVSSYTLRARISLRKKNSS